MSDETYYPAATAEALAMMKADLDLLMGEKRRLSDEAQDARRVVSSANAEYERIMGRAPGGDGTPRGFTREQIAEAAAKVAAAEAESQRRHAIARAHDEENRTASWAKQRCERYLAQPDVAGRPLRPHPGSVMPKRRGSETHLAAVMRVRGEIENLQAELAALADRPLPAKDAKASARRQVEALAVANAPDVGPLFFGKPAKLPATDITQYSRGPRIAYDVPDSLALFTWTFSDALISKLENAIDAAADDDNALTAEQKAAETARLKGEILTNERVEEALIEAASVERQTIDRRPKADPRAVLWLAADMPVPE